MSSKQEPLVINGWENGIAESPHQGIGLIQNADIKSFPGAVKVGRELERTYSLINTRTFTADPSTNTCTASGTIDANINITETFAGAAVYFTTTGTLPGGLSPNTIYYLALSAAANNTTFRVCTSYKNSAGTAAVTEINITDTGTGTHTMHAVPIGTINWIKEDPKGNRIWMLDSNGRVWWRYVGNSNQIYLLHNSAIDTGSSPPTLASGQGLVLSSFSNTNKMYLFVFRNTNIDVIDVYNTAAIEALSWNNAWQAMNESSGNDSHEAISAQDDAIYFCNNRYIGSIIEKVDQTFDPSNTATYTYNSQALDLQTHDEAQCIEELGVNLLIGGKNSNKIYPWNRTAKSFNMPLIVPEFNIKKLKNIGGIVYILAGTWGNIYTTQGTYVKHFKKIPTYIINNDYTITASPITWGGIGELNGSLVFGLSGQTTGSSGLYRLYPDGRLIQENIPSTGSTNVTSFFAKDATYHIGYNGGVDKLKTSQYTTGYPTVLHSKLEKVGTKTNKASYSKLEVVLARPMTSGNIRVSYRTGLAASFTTLDTYTSDASTTSFETDIGLIDLENIQFQVEMQGDPDFLELRLYP